LTKNFKEMKMVAEYAAQLLVTPNYLNRIIKNITGFFVGHISGNALFWRQKECVDILLQV